MNQFKSANIVIKQKHTLSYRFLYQQSVSIQEEVTASEYPKLLDVVLAQQMVAVSTGSQAAKIFRVKMPWSTMASWNLKQVMANDPKHITSSEIKRSDP